MEDCTSKEVYAFKLFFNYISELVKYGLTPEREEFILKELDNSINFSCHPIFTESFPEIKRLTINKRILAKNHRIYDISMLKYPPSKYVTKYGRCNLRAESILYAAFDMLTVLSELKPEKGDLITISTWKAIDESTLTFVPIIRQPSGGTINPRTWNINKAYQSSLKDYPVNIKSKIILLNEFMADAFTKRITSGNDSDYIISAYFANRILNKYENGAIDAIYYPSVQSGLNFENLAIKPQVFDAKYKLVEVNESTVDMDHNAGAGGVMMLGIDESETFDFESGKIIWNNSYRQPPDVMSYIKENYGYER